MRFYVFRLLPFTLLLFLHPVCAQKFTFVAPPLISPDQAPHIYQPFVGFINQVSEKEFSYKNESSWHAYLKGLRNGDYDLVLEEAHIVGWLVRKHNYQPLVRLVGNADIVVLKNKQDRNIYSLSDLAGYTVCGPPAPRLSHILLQLQFNNPHRQPIFNIAGGYKHMIKALYAQKCQAVVLPLAMYTKLDKDSSSSATRIIYQSQPLPNLTFNASPGIPVHISEQITTALLSKSGRDKTQALRRHFLSVGGFVAAQAELLKNQWGFG